MADGLDKLVKKTAVVVDERYNAFSIYRMHERKQNELKKRYDSLPHMRAKMHEVSMKLAKVIHQTETLLERMREIGTTNSCEKKKRTRRKSKKTKLNEELDAADSKSDAKPSPEVINVFTLTNELHSIKTHEDSLRTTIAKMQQEIDFVESKQEQEQYDLDSYRILNQYFCVRAALNEFDRLVADGEIVVDAAKPETEVDSKRTRITPEEAACTSKEYNNRLAALTHTFVRNFFPNEANTTEIDECNGVTSKRVLDEAVSKQTEQEYSWSYDQIRSCVSSVRVYTYKRLNHFREYLRQRQGKSHVYLPPSIWDKIKAELAKFHCLPENYNTRLTFQLMEQVLKRLQLNKYYEHTRYLTMRLNPNIKTLDIPAARECRMCQRFTELEAPFEKFKHTIVKTRKNFMSYPFVAWKIAELEDWPEYLSHFKLLKSGELLVLQDKWWELATKMLHWPFHRTIGRIESAVDQ